MSAYTSLERPAAAEAPRSAKAAWIVIGIAMAIGCAMGVFLFLRAKESDIAIRQWMFGYAERGTTLTANGCVEDVLKWYSTTCDAPTEMCLQGVPMGVGHCLKAKDRAEDCKAIGPNLKDAKWTYAKCLELGIDKKSQSKKACTAAWEAYDSFCRSNQEGVAL